MVSQEQFINKVLGTGDYALITNNALTVDYFYNTTAEFNFIKNHFEKYNKVPDIDTFKNTFPDFIVSKVSEPVSYLLEQLYKDYNTAYLATSFNNLKHMLENGNTDDAVEYFKKAVDGLHTGTVSECIDLLKDKSRYDTFLKRSENLGKAYISTGFPELDRLIGGIDCSEENMVITARTGIGKSWVLDTIATSAASAGKRVGLYSGEMSTDKVGYRIDTLLGGIPNNSITRGNADPIAKAQYKRYMDDLVARDDLGALYVLTPNDVGGDFATVADLQAFIERYNLDILLVDQYSLVKDLGKAQAEWERISNISKAIKKLQVLKQMPIVSVVQMNRTKNEDDEQDTNQIAGADRIGQDATTILMLSRKNPSPDKDPKQEQLIIYIKKARDGGDGKKLVYQANFNTGEFHYLDVAENEDEAKKAKDDYAK